MKKLFSLMVIAMFALSMSLGTFADDKSTTKSSTGSEQKPKKSKKSKKSTSSTKSTSDKSSSAAPSK